MYYSLLSQPFVYTGNSFDASKTFNYGWPAERLLSLMHLMGTWLSSLPPRSHFQHQIQSAIWYYKQWKWITWKMKASNRRILNCGCGSHMAMNDSSYSSLFLLCFLRFLLLLLVDILRCWGWLIGSLRVYSFIKFSSTSTRAETQEKNIYLQMDLTTK